MACIQHQFVRVKDVERYNPGGRTVAAVAARVVCAECGEIRDVWEDGKIDIIKP
jgi:hypothetical protein